MYQPPATDPDSKIKLGSTITIGQAAIIRHLIEGTMDLRSAMAVAGVSTREDIVQSAVRALESVTDSHLPVQIPVRCTCCGHKLTLVPCVRCGNRATYEVSR
jgi:queuine/archaeosine tRNA-ribosyltransferase